MTPRELSEKLSTIASQLDDLAENGNSSTCKRVLTLIADELHELSKEEYVPPGSWDSIKPKQPNRPSKKQPYTNTAGKKLPF